MKNKKVLFLASFLLFLLSYTNNYAQKVQDVTLHRDKLEYLTGLNEEELRRLILKIRDIKKDNLTVSDLKKLNEHESHIQENFFVLNYNNYDLQTINNFQKITYINKNDAKNKTFLFFITVPLPHIYPSYFITY